MLYMYTTFIYICLIVLEQSHDSAWKLDNIF